MIVNLYKWLWEKICKHPFTTYIREDFQREPSFYLALFLFSGMLVGHYTTSNLWQIILVLTIGVLIGHLFFW